jgi:hypothetical protein
VTCLQPVRAPRTRVTGARREQAAGAQRDRSVSWTVAQENLGEGTVRTGTESIGRHSSVNNTRDAECALQNLLCAAVPPAAAKPPASRRGSWDSLPSCRPIRLAPCHAPTGHQGRGRQPPETLKSHSYPRDPDPVSRGEASDDGVRVPRTE